MAAGGTNQKRIGFGDLPALGRRRRYWSLNSGGVCCSEEIERGGWRQIKCDILKLDENSQRGEEDVNEEWLDAWVMIQPPRRSA